MGIEIDVINEQPYVNRNRIYLSRLEVVQKRQEDNRLAPKYAVQVEWYYYGVDSNNKRHFSIQLDEVNFPDYLSHAMSQAENGDLRHIQALKAIEGAVAAIITDQLNTTVSII